LRIFVISDTHGKIEKAAEILKKLQDIDMVIHLGDLWKDAEKLRNQFTIPVLSVKGNMDGCFSKDEYKILETDFGKIFIAHGHMENVKQGPQNIMYKAESLGCRAIFFGHTHKPVFLEIERMYLLNPGSLTLPTGGEKGSYAVATIEKDSLRATILYEDLKQLSKTDSGFLKDLLNNSDRF